MSLRLSVFVGTSLTLLSLGISNTAYSAEAMVKVKNGGLRVTYGESAFRIGGRAQFDAAYVDDDVTEIPSGTDVRRARIFIKGKIDKDWSFKVQYDFSDHVMKDMYFSYKGWDAGTITVGQFAPAMFLESWTSSKWTTFIERAVVDNFALDRELGVQFARVGDNYSFYTSITGDNMDSDEPGNDSYSLVGRYTYSPKHDEGDVLHFGTTVALMEAPDMAPNNDVSYGARPGSKVDGGAKLVSGGVADASQTVLVGLETAYVQGPLSIQAEYLVADVEAADGAEDEDYSAYYIAGSWFLTGESRSYYVDGGVFDAPVMTKNAWEVGLRFDHTDLSDDKNGDSSNTGELDTITLGLNFYPNNSIRFSANLINADVDRTQTGDGVDEDVKIFQLRSQLVF